MLGRCERAQTSATAQRGTDRHFWRCSSARETNGGSRERARSRCTLQVRWSTAGRTTGAAATRSGRATSAQPSTSPTAPTVEGSYPSHRTIVRRVRQRARMSPKGGSVLCSPRPCGETGAVPARRVSASGRHPEGDTRTGAQRVPAAQAAEDRLRAVKRAVRQPSGSRPAGGAFPRTRGTRVARSSNSSLKKAPVPT